MMRSATRGWLLAAVACAPPKAPAEAPVEAVKIALIERGRLVAVDEQGERLALLTGEGDIDMNPVVSPDGKWLAFARGSADAAIRLYVMPATVGGVPKAVTTNGQTLFPSWTADGAALIASVRNGEQLDLVRVPIDGGKPTQLTTTADDEITPQAGPNGAIVYAVRVGAKTQIWRREADGTIQRATTGDADSSPAWGPEGSLIFTRPVIRKKSDGTFVDSDLFIADARGERLLQELDGTDESGATLSRDKRYLFFTSVLFSQEAEPRRISEAVVFVDLATPGAKPQVLKAADAWTRRKHPALVAEALHAETLARAPIYHQALRDVLVNAVRSNQP